MAKQTIRLTRILRTNLVISITDFSLIPYKLTAMLISLSSNPSVLDRHRFGITTHTEHLGQKKKGKWIPGDIFKEKLGWLGVFMCVQLLESFESVCAVQLLI